LWIICVGDYHESGSFTEHLSLCIDLHPLWLSGLFTDRSSALFRATEVQTLCSFLYFLSSAGLQWVFLSDGQYCRERKVYGIRTYVAIDPQPPASDVITVTRCYGTSGLDPKFKKRVSWLVDDDGPSNVAVVEYKGVQRNLNLSSHAL